MMPRLWPFHRYRPDDMHDLAESLLEFASEMRKSRRQRKIEFEWLKSHLKLATKHDLEEMEKRIMSKFSDYATKQEAFNDRTEKALDSIVASNAGITQDIADLNKAIIDAQNSPEDVAKMEALREKGEALAVKAEAQATALAALDAQTPPAPPPA